MSEFGHYIKKIREEKGYTLNQVATYSGISAAQLSRIENGKRGVPKPSTIAKLAKALKVNYEELMTAAGYIDEYFGEHQAVPVVLEEQAPLEEKDVAKWIKQFRKDLEKSEELSFDGDPLTTEARESLLESMELIYKQTQRINKINSPK